MVAEKWNELGRMHAGWAEWAVHWRRVVAFGHPLPIGPLRLGVEGTSVS